MSEVQTRFLREIGTRAYLRLYWGDDCPNSFGSGAKGCHNGQTFLAETLKGRNDNIGGSLSDYADDDPRWPTKCDHCDTPLPPWPAKVPCPCGCGQLRDPQGAPRRVMSLPTLYQAQDGTKAIRHELVPGDMFWATWFNCVASGHCIHGWTNCDGKHLIVVVGPPGNHHWDTNGRASNCGLPNDTLHRCWCVHGNPELGEPVTVDKNGLTCTAGGGSIQAGSYHGVLSGGVLRGDDPPVAIVPVPPAPDLPTTPPSTLPSRDPVCQAQNWHYSNCNCVDRTPFS